MPEDEPRKVDIGVGQPGWWRLNAWARELSLAFDETPYHVGSSLYTKQWRDIDVRMILDDDVFEVMFGPWSKAKSFWMGARWNAMCTAFSLWGREATGLPIDFQFQPQSWANEHESKLRNALGIVRRADGAWVHRATHNVLEPPEAAQEVTNG